MPGGESFEADSASASRDLDQLVRRLRSLSPNAWQTRREPVRAALAALVAISAELEGRPLEVPAVADHVLADAIAVIAGDALEAVCAASNGELLVDLRGVLARVLTDTK